MPAILYENLLRTGTASSVGTVSGSIVSLCDGRTSTSEQFATGATREFVIDNGAAVTVNCLAIARHNFGTTSADITVQGSTDNVSYSTLWSISPTDDKVIFDIKSSNYSYRYYKIQVSGHTAQAYATDIAIGDNVMLERDQKSGFTPPEYADRDKVIPNITRGQNLVGLSIQQAPKDIRLVLPYYTSSFFSTNWESFVASIKQYPFYLSWKTDNTADRFYCWPKSKVPTAAYASGVSGYSHLNASMMLQGITA